MPIHPDDLRRAIGTSELVGQPALEEMLTWDEGDGAPTHAPSRIGKDYLDTTGNAWYRAHALAAGAGSWTKLSN